MALLRHADRSDDVRSSGYTGSDRYGADDAMTDSRHCRGRLAQGIPNPLRWLESASVGMSTTALYAGIPVLHWPAAQILIDPVTRLPGGVCGRLGRGGREQHRVPVGTVQDASGLRAGSIPNLGRPLEKRQPMRLG